MLNKLNNIVYTLTWKCSLLISNMLISAQSNEIQWFYPEIIVTVDFYKYEWFYSTLYPGENGLNGKFMPFTWFEICWDYGISVRKITLYLSLQPGVKKYKKIFH